MLDKFVMEPLRQARARGAVRRGTEVKTLLERAGAAEPTPETHAIWTGLKAGHIELEGRTSSVYVGRRINL